MRIDYPRAGRSGVRRWLPSWRQLLALGAAGAAAVVAGFLYLYATIDIPNPNDLATAQTSVITYADGTPIGTVAVANRTSVRITDVPITVQREVLSAEDRAFYEHGGFSPAGIARAAWNNLRGGSTQGGSTITQQYAKNAYLTQERTVDRKVKELVLSVKLNQSRSKDRILEDYLNTIYFGRGAYGIQAAAQAYFRVDAQDLTPAQGAMLASIIRSPNGYAPESNRDRLVGRWNYVLDGMVEKGWMTQEQREDQTFPKVKPRPAGNRLAGENGYLVDMVRRELARLGYSEDEVARGGYRITTTFDEKAVQAARDAVEKRGPQSGTKGLRIGIAAVKPGTGAVVAIYGGDDYLKDQFNNATQGVVQAGSTFKPFALAAGLEEGVSLFDRFSGRNGDVFEFPGFAPYKVTNFDDFNAGGSISLLRATSASVNSAYVDLQQQITPEKVVEAAERAGIPSDAAGLTAGPTTVLGTSSPHTIDMATAYATFAAGGLRADWYVVQEVRKANGGLLYQKRPAPTRAFEQSVTDDVTVALRRVVTNGSGFAAQDLGRPSAGKTGTTNSNLSAWYVGYTPDIAVAVSMAKSSSDGGLVTLRGTGGLSRVTGGSFPARMWTAFVKQYLDGTPITRFDGTVVTPGADRGSNDSGSTRNDRPRPRSTSTPDATATPAPTPRPTLTTKPTATAPATPGPTPKPPKPPKTP